ncbi:hypothetical protein [Oceanobacillus halophilus]|uniref:hypothetical protein n=1 Tax=Oceanobacillus halophilus TaxID=930130 RepID=UPI0014731597|nr:hypothetical protein [Oceanobacillus halophilus]
MNNAMIGFLFIFCLLVGVGLGSLFQSMEVGGAIGLSIGLLLVLLFRRNRRKYR